MNSQWQSIRNILGAYGRNENLFLSLINKDGIISSATLI